MAQDRLSSYVACAAVLAFGAGVEVVAGQSLASSLADWTVGAAFVLAAVSRPRRPADPVALLAASLWFLATLALTPDGWWHSLDGPLALAYRGPVMHLLARSRMTGRLRWPVLVPAYALPLLVTAWTGWLTSLLAAVLTALVARREHLSAAALALLAAVWAGTALGLLGWVAGDIALVVAAAVVGWQHRTAGRAVAGMVVELGQDDRPATPLAASLAEALGDPDLRIVVFAPGEGWRDDAGRPAAPPDLDVHAGRVTLVPVAGGGSLALVHGPAVGADPDLLAAAARAAVLVLERVRFATRIRLTAEDVRRSGARLLAVDEQEREALAARLEAGPRRRLARVRTLLAPGADGGPRSPILERLDQVDGELDRLGRGLLPDMVAHGPLGEALRLLASDLPLSCAVTVDGPIDDLPEPTRALVYFVTAECLTNAARYSRAAATEVTVRFGSTLRVEVRDDGVGGARLTPGRGLQGLSDRVTLAGGTLTVASPPGGPTLVMAELAVRPP